MDVSQAIHGDFTGLARNYALGRREFPSSVFSFLEVYLPEDEPARILDAGCGTGISTRQLALYLKRKVLGIDRDEDMVAEAKRSPMKDVGYARSDLTTINFEPRSFAAVTAFSSFHWFADDAYIVGRLVNLVRPGGCFMAVNVRAIHELIPEWPRILEDWARGPVRSRRDGYDPAKTLAEHRLRIHHHTRTDLQYYTPKEALAYFQSTSKWNAVSVKDRPEVLGRLRRLIEQRMNKDGLVPRNVEVRAVLGVRYPG